MSSRADHYDAIVIGVGGMGSATAYHLARRGVDTLGLERFDIPHSRGSSHGLTRIIRRSRYVESAYVSLINRAFELWNELDDSIEESLFHRTGYVAAGPTDGDVYSEALESCLENDLEHEVLSSAELTARYPGFELPDSFGAILDPSGGFLHAERCIVAHVEAAMAEGADIRAREPVIDWSPTSDGGVRIETAKAEYTANVLVVTAGSWASELLQVLADSAVPERQVLGWFRPSQPTLFEPETFPVFSMSAKEGHFYGFPQYSIPGFKLGKHHHLGETADPNDVGEPNRQDEQVLREFTERYFPGAAGPTMKLETCLFTNTPDEEFVLDHHPEYSQVIVGAGFSGHGFKMSSAIGEMLADLAIDGETHHPRELFRIDRFGEWECPY